MTATTATDRIEPAPEMTRPGQHPAVPTGWGRWPTCACPRETRSAPHHPCS
jgi:hypothetical protein